MNEFLCRAFIKATWAAPISPRCRTTDFSDHLSSERGGVMRVLSKVKFVALLMGSAAIFAGPAMAADAVAPTADEAGSNRLDEVTVTARRRAESEQKVAAALTVVSGAELDRRNIQTVNDLENSVPNLEVTSQLGGGQPQFRIRGVGLTDYAANNTGTGGA